MPTRETIESHRWSRPFARRIMAPSLWRFTRRSVPRGVALGIATGILIPMGQIPAAAVLALPLRANIPAAAATTFVTNPVTTPPLWVGAYWLGSWMLDLKGALPGISAPEQSWTDWIVAEAGPATLAGLLTITLVLGLLGYLASAIGWRLWVARKWRRRGARRSLLPFD